jgi:CheY-like chemotaxis protein
MSQKSKVPILIADDDPEDRQLIKEALEESRLLNEVQFVGDGEELLAHLEKSQTLPGLILLDLNMPRMDGREALKEIKSNPKYRAIPVVVLTTSKAEEDVYRTYNLGVNSFVTKPVTFSSLVEIMRDLGRYWFEIVELPKEQDTAR